MTKEEVHAVDETIDDLRKALRRCDATQTGQRAAIQIDFAIHLLMQERSGPQADVLR